MDQADRDRLVSLKKAKKKLTTQKEAAEELDITETTGAEAAAEVEEAGRQRRGACVAGTTVQPED